jgi:hypothetical protein
MVVYEVYWLDPTGEYQLIGILPERRKTLIRITKKSVMNWGKMLLGDNVDSKKIFFKRLTIDSLADRILWHDLFFNNHTINFIN